ncbi:MAG: PASTA domain-containing protein [Proteobacteria bacterium]|nr:PASTA domain-containing protein [Pseudomonadota bacterium]MBU1686327.1 PASTA domain-containing protein [Pseudomonadota bacterium]
MKQVRRNSSKKKRKNRWGAVVLVLLTGIAWSIWDGWPLTRNEDGSGAVSAGEGPVAEASGRAMILDRAFRELAVTVKMSSIYARPLEIENPEKVVGELASLLNVDGEKLSQDLRGELGYVWLGRHLPEEKVQLVREKHLEGIYIVDESRRYYPQGDKAAHVLGFVKDGRGLAGIESFYDGLLRGVGGMSGQASDQAGGHLLLTLDLGVQQEFERLLHRLVKETEANTAMGAVLDPNNGSVLALVSLPGFDPNQWWESDSGARTNKIMEERLDVGAAAGLLLESVRMDLQNGRESAEVSAQTTDAPGNHGAFAALRAELQLANGASFGPEPGSWYSSGEQVISAELVRSETAVEVSDAVSQEYFHRAGWDRGDSFDLPAAYQIDDVGGRFSDLSAMDLLTGFSIMMNGGKGIIPHLADRVIDPQTGQVREINQELHDQVLRPETSRMAAAWLGRYSRPSEGVFLEILNPRAINPNGPESVDVLVKGASPGRYQTILLGAFPRRDPRMCLIVVLGEAALSGKGKTPMRTSFEKGFTLLTQAAGVKATRTLAQALEDRNALWYEAWLEVMNPSEKVAAQPQVSTFSRMPDVRGISLRRALQRLQPYGLDVGITGFGRVVEQEPRAGETLKADQKCQLVLSSALVANDI